VTFTRLAATRLVLLLAALLPVALVVTPPLSYLGASSAPAARAVETDDEGGTASLRAALDKASRGFIEARNRLRNSQAAQARINRQLSTGEAEVARLTTEVATYGSEAYRDGGLAPVTALLDSGSVPRFVDRIGMLQQLSRGHQRKIDELQDAKDRLTAQREKLAGEIRVQQAQQATMAKQRVAAERALAVVGGLPSSGFGNEASPSAQPAPRNSDGSWPRESCSIDDPTSGGCLTPRMNHARLQSIAAGFTRYTACFRSASYGEHGKGRACDFSASRTTFGGEATGDERDYGNRLAAYFVANADRLAVLYVIWFRQIWMPGTGWRSYSGSGSPSAAHTNHVHLSVQ
jgi:hypothetical protein